MTKSIQPKALRSKTEGDTCFRIRFSSFDGHFCLLSSQMCMCARGGHAALVLIKMDITNVFDWQSGFSVIFNFTFKQYLLIQKPLTLNNDLSGLHVRHLRKEAHLPHKPPILFCLLMLLASTTSICY